jgi:hypothetical protein
MNTITEEHLSTADFVSTGNKKEERMEERRPGDSEASGPLLPADFAQDLRGRWDRIQTGFVDDPRKSVQEADELVAAAMKRLAEGFADARNNLERQWGRGDDVSTEDLRVALQKYRAFFQRLLTV